MANAIIQPRLTNVNYKSPLCKAIDMTECNGLPLVFSSLGRKKIQADFQGGKLTSDAGAALLREVDRRTAANSPARRADGYDYWPSCSARSAFFSMIFSMASSGIRGRLVPSAYLFIPLSRCISSAGLISGQSVPKSSLSRT